MALPDEEREALLRVVGHKIFDICNRRDAKLSLSYHRIKGYEYPALVVHCGKRRKIHINKSEWEAYMVEKEKIKLEKVLSILEKLKNFRMWQGTEKFLLETLKELKEAFSKPSYWEFLFQMRENLPKGTFPYWKFEDEKTTVEIWDIWGTKELKLVITKRDVVRGEIKTYERIPYLCKEKTSYILSVEPLRILKILPQGVEINNRWVIRKTNKGLYLNLENL